MKIATWNVNSIKVRLPNLQAWLAEAAPDVVLLQETKATDETFPRAEIEAAGYNVAVHGQRTYNGVAILSKFQLTDIRVGLPGDDGDEQARYLEAWVDSGDTSDTGGGVRVATIYLPNGNPLGTDKFSYKLGWMDRLVSHAESLLRAEEPFVLGGDYNVAPRDVDLFDAQAFDDDAITQPETRARYRTLVNLGLTEAWLTLHGDVGHVYSFWDYQAGAWQRDRGVRIDLLLLSPQAADRLTACEIDKGPRGWEKASDHTPVWCELSNGAT